MWPDYDHPRGIVGVPRQPALGSRRARFPTMMRPEYHVLDRAFDPMLTRSRLDEVPHPAIAIGVEKVRAADNTRGPFQ
jgi:hypothetical protein